MDRRSQASMTYRIVTEMLGLSLVAGALVTFLRPNMSVPHLVQGLMLYAVVFSMMVMAWWQLGGMSAVGVFWGKFSGVAGIALAFVLVTIPVFLHLLVAASGEVQNLAALLLTVDFALVAIFMALLIRMGNVYQSKRQWRLAHHTLWIAGVLYLLSLVIPIAKVTYAGIPLRVLAWVVILLIPPFIRRVGSTYVATPARPPSPRPAESMGDMGRASAGSPRDEGPTSSGENQQDRRQRRRFRPRRQGGSRRRM